jgi:hypothetical protein
MKKMIIDRKEVELKTIHVEAAVRYWEDGEVNGVEDTDGKLIPCREGGLWKPIIDLDTGVITNWEQGKEAYVHYKVCDSGSYYIKDENGETVLSIEDDYVPAILCPKEPGYGDYIIMSIDKTGKIDGWVAKDPDIKALYILNKGMEQSTGRMRLANLQFVLSKWGFKVSK